MTDRKYTTEAKLGLASEKCFLVRPCDIEVAKSDHQYRDELKQCHIYAISKRPRVTLVPGSLHSDDTYQYGQLCFRCSNGVRIEDFRTPRQDPHPRDLMIEVSDYPHDLLIWRFSNGKLATGIPVALAAYTLQGNFHELLDNEIIYIGQAYGPDGHRSALKRLATHSTLQKIQADLMAHEPDSEIILLLFKYIYPPYCFFEIDPTVPAIKNADEDRQHFQNVLWDYPQESETITIAEAALIRYFQPYYNKVYKDSFPSTNLECLHSCYNLDFHSLVVEIDSGDGAPAMYSEKVTRGTHHMAIYNLHKEEERRAFFGLESGPFP